MPQPPIEEESPVIPGWADAPITGDRVDVSTEPIVVGDPGGGRIEIRDTGFHAFDASGAETASIAGEGGEFVGGEFRTSDTLPGQVVLSDNAHQGTPGIAVEPDDSTGYDVLPSIGPGTDHMSISGGVSTAGDMAGAQFGAGSTNLYWNGPGATGGGSWAAVADGEAGLRCRPDRTNAAYESAIRARANDAVVYSEGPNGTGFISASPGSAYLAHDGPGDAMARSESRAKADPESLMLERKIPGVADRHRLMLDDDGVWVQTVFGAGTVSYNLLETAQDSGWRAITVGAGITASSDIAWRNKGGMIYFRGSVRASWSGDWDTVATLPPEARPDSTFVVLAATAGGGSRIRMTSAGSLDIDAASAGELTFFLNPLSYPLG